MRTVVASSAVDNGTTSTTRFTDAIQLQLLSSLTKIVVLSTFVTIGRKTSKQSP